MKTLIKYNLLLVSLIFCFTPAQEVKSQDFGADVVSSYVWRGTQFGTGPHVQPWMELGAGNLQVVSGEALVLTTMQAVTS